MVILFWRISMQKVCMRALERTTPPRSKNSLTMACRKALRCVPPLARRVFFRGFPRNLILCESARPLVIESPLGVRCSPHNAKLISQIKPQGVPLRKEG